MKLAKQLGVSWNNNLRALLWETKPDPENRSKHGMFFEHDGTQSDLCFRNMTPCYKDSDWRRAG